jgi:hypothetical protein
MKRAGFLYRRHKQQKVPLSDIATELGIHPNEAKHLIAVYQFMLKQEDYDRGRWSFYDEYLKSTKIKKARDEYQRGSFIQFNGLEQPKITWLPKPHKPSGRD